MIKQSNSIPENNKESDSENYIYIPKEEGVPMDNSQNSKSVPSNNKSNDSLRSTTPLSPFFAEFISKVKFR